MHFEWAAIKCQGLARETRGGGIKPASTQAGGDGGEGPWASPRAALVGAGSDGAEGCDCPGAGHREPGAPQIPGKEEDEDGGCHARRRRAAPEKGERHMKGAAPLTPTVPRRSPRLAEQRQRLLCSGPIKRWVALEGGPDKYKGIRQVKGVSGGAKGGDAEGKPSAGD